MYVDAGAGLASAYPVIFDAGESFAIEVNGSFGVGALAQRPCVKDGYDEE